GGLGVENRPVLVVDRIAVGLEEDAVAALADGVEEVLARAGEHGRADSAGRIAAGVGAGRGVGLGRRRKLLGRLLGAAGGQRQRCRDGGDGEEVPLHAYSLLTDAQGRIGPQAGSDPSSGVGILRSWVPVRSTCQTLDRPERPWLVRKNWITRPLGDQLGASSCQLSVSSRSPPPDGLITPIRKLPAILVKAMRSPRGLHSG